MGRRQLCQAKGYVNEQFVSDNRIVTANATGYPKAVMSFVDKYYSPHRHSPHPYSSPSLDTLIFYIYEFVTTLFVVFEK